MLAYLSTGLKGIEKTMLKQLSGPNPYFFSFRLHKKTLDKKINSTHDCQDYWNCVESKFQEFPPTSNLINAHGFHQPLCIYARNHFPAQTT